MNVSPSQVSNRSGGQPASRTRRPRARNGMSELWSITSWAPTAGTRCRCTAPPRTRPKPPRAVDHLGGDPVASFAATAAELEAAFGEPGAMARTARHRAGERNGAQLLGMRVLDIAVHTWDLARAIRAGESLDSDVVAFALTLRDTFDAGRQRGAFAPPPGKTPADS